MRIQLPHGNRQRQAISAASALLIIVLIAVVGIAAYMIFPSNPAASAVNNAVHSATSNNVPGKIQFNIQDLLAGGGSAATVNVYPVAGTQLGGVTYSGLTKSDSGTAASSGVYTTSLQYPVGAMLNVEVTETNFVSQWFSVESLGVTAAAQAQGTASQINLFITKLGTFSISVVDDAGNSYTSNTTVGNFTNSGHCTANNKCLGETTINFAVTVRNTVANTGYATSTNPLTTHSWGDGLEFYTTGSSVTVNALQSVVRGSDTYWAVPIPDGISNGQASGSGISMQTINSANVGGVYTFNLAVAKGSLAAGGSQSIVIEQQLYGDVSYFLSHSGSWNPSATTTNAASSFTLKLAA